VNGTSRTSTPTMPESGPGRPASRVLARESVPLGGAIGLFGLTAAALVGYGGVLWVCAGLSAVGALGMLARRGFLPFS